MRQEYRRTGWLALLMALALVVVWTLPASVASADGNAQEASGDALRETSFTTYGYGNTALTFTQTLGEAYLLESGSLRTLQMWGRYHIYYTVNNATYQAEWSSTQGSTYTLTLPVTGSYRVRVVPYTNSEMASYYSPSQFRGWKITPKWTMTGTSSGGIITAQPTSYYGNYTLPVYYRTLQGATLRTESLSLNNGTYTISPNYAPAGYTLVGSSSYQVTVTNGTCAVSQIVFYYTQTSVATPTPAAISTVYVPVYYRATDGTLLRSESRALQNGTQVIQPSYTPTGYTLSGQNIYYVMVSNGIASPSSVTFYYARTATPTPANTSVYVPVYYRSTDGTLLRTESVLLNNGTYNVQPSYAPTGYTISGQNQYYVTVSNGIATPASVTFYYAKTATPTPANVTVYVPVYYYTTEGTLLSTETMPLSNGTYTVRPSYTPAGYIISGQGSCQVKVSGGKASPSSVTFYYAKTATPTPANATVYVPVYYYTTDGTFLSTETLSLTNGTYTVRPSYTPSGYKISGQGSYQVKVSRGKASPASVTFYFAKTATPTPANVTVYVPVYYYTTDGTLLSTESLSLTNGTYTVKPSYTPAGYTISGQGSYQVRISKGKASPSSVTFYFAKNATPVPDVPVTIPIYYRTVSGDLLKAETITLTKGTHTIHPSYTPAGFTISGQDSWTVKVSNGKANVSEIVFTYKAKSSTATVTVYYYTAAGTELQKETVKLKPGTHTIVPSRNFKNYALSSATSVQVTVSADGIANPSVVTFTYTRTTTPTPDNVTKAPPTVTTPAPGVTPVPWNGRNSGGNIVPIQSYDTQFKEKTARAPDNKKRIENMPKMLDDNPETAFVWLLYDSERKDDIPEFTFYFDNQTVGAMEIRNGVSRSSQKYNQNARLVEIEVKVYTANGKSYSENIKIPDSCKTDYRHLNFSRTYNNVTKIEIWYRMAKLGSENKYSLYITDLRFCIK